MSPTQRLLIGAIVLITGAAGFGTGRTLFRPKDRVVQPILFNHRLHVADLEMDCDVCHLYYKEREHSGLPLLDTCLDCHEEPLTENPEEEKIRELAAAGRVDPFRKLFRIPEHTHYSHGRHAGSAEIECRVCHGAIDETEAPPEYPMVRIDMDFCLDCHEQNGIHTDCTGCHH